MKKYKYVYRKMQSGDIERIALLDVEEDEKKSSKMKI